MILQTRKCLKNQQEKTDDVANAIYQMTTSMDEVKYNAHQAAEAAKSCETEANEGMAVVSETIKTL